MDWVKTLVLGGGGVKSIAYLGAMEEMVRMGTEWKSFVNGIERVAGASAGAFSAVCIAAKKSLEELQTLLVSFDSSLLFEDGLVEGLVRGLITIFTYPLFGIVPFSRLEELYKKLLVDMGFSSEITLEQFYDKTGTLCDIYVSNITLKHSECWNAKTHPEMHLSFALAVSSSLPVLIQLPVIGGEAYADGGIVQNVPIGNDYDPRETLALMVDIESRGTGVESVPTWFGHLFSRVFDCDYEGHMEPVFGRDRLWMLRTVRLVCKSVTLMDTFVHGKLPDQIVRRGKEEGAVSFRQWRAEQALLQRILLRGAKGTLVHSVGQADRRATESKAYDT